MPAVIDANCWCLFVDEELAESPGDGTAIFSRADAGGGVLFDQGVLIKQQYIDMRKPYAEQIFDNWLGTKIAFGKARIVAVDGNANVNKSLRALNIPAKEHIFFKTAICGGASYIVSLDSDFFDPASKKAGEKAKAAIVVNARGPVPKACSKLWKLSVRCPTAYINSPP
ncbi:MAG: hypothetical protein EOP04_25305 [Proteobacteria bacterium]|nr:MAG: hypothetical protein EOP04_25305 [Pseudomonadota bacterium]